MFCIEHAYYSRTKPAAPNPEPGTTATCDLDEPVAQLHVIGEDLAVRRLLADVGRDVGELVERALRLAARNAGIARRSSPS